jgi:hypothetical protein
MAGFCQALEITLPFSVPLAAQLVKYRPRVEARIVAVVEDEPHGVVTDGLDAHDADALLARDELAFAGAVAFDLRGRRVHA